MTLQNRVDPWGGLHAVAGRGTMMGNRGGKFHRDDKTLGKRRWASHHWICCELHFRGMHHEAMGQGYTSLFFLDEVTALAAGHRPCFFCRRAEAKAFLGNSRVEAFDRQLHNERMQGPRGLDGGPLPDATMLDIGGTAHALKDGLLLRWSFAGYRPSAERIDPMRAKLLTPPAILSILRGGYKPRWHESAVKGDG
jgi:hypothetical protein